MQAKDVAPLFELSLNIRMEPWRVVSATVKAAAVIRGVAATLGATGVRDQKT
jgi:hypothetical protein